MKRRRAVIEDEGEEQGEEIEMVPVVNRNQIVEHRCEKCKRTCRSKAGLVAHQKACNAGRVPAAANVFFGDDDGNWGDWGIAPAPEEDGDMRDAQPQNAAQVAMNQAAGLIHPQQEEQGQQQQQADDNGIEDTPLRAFLTVDGDFNEVHCPVSGYQNERATYQPGQIPRMDICE